MEELGCKRRTGGAGFLKVTIVCPCYNEAREVASSIDKLKTCINSLPNPAEVLLIDDGSFDETAGEAERAMRGDGRFRLIRHKVNYGRGRALRTGIREASGDIIVTTEGDLSWGQETIMKMIRALERDRGLDAVFASTHAAGGGYQNVPRHRIWLSKLGSQVFRLLYTGKLSMITGMTRAYRASIIQPQTFFEDDKEIHLEIAHRLLKLRCRIAEVPAVLSWPDQGRSGRTKWARIARLVSTHLAFGVFRGLSRIIGPIISFLTLATCGFGGWAIWNLLHGGPSIFLVQLSGVLLILWVTLVLGYFSLYYAVQLEINIWKTQSMIAQWLCAQGLNPDGNDYYYEVPLIANQVVGSGRSSANDMAA